MAWRVLRRQNVSCSRTLLSDVKLRLARKSGAGAPLFIARVFQSTRFLRSLFRDHGLFLRFAIIDIAAAGACKRAHGRAFLAANQSTHSRAT